MCVVGGVGVGVGVGGGQCLQTFREPPGSRLPAPAAWRRTPCLCANPAVEAREAAVEAREAAVEATEAAVEATEAESEDSSI